MLIMEAARPGGQRFTKALAGAIVASSVSFGIYFAIAGAAFVAVYQVPRFKFEDWQLGAGPAASSAARSSPTLFLGGTAGVIVHLVIPGVPLGLAFACLLAAVPGSLVNAPFTMVLLAAFLTQLGALQTAPVLLAVITAYLAMEGIRYLVASRKQEAAEPGGTAGQARGERAARA